MNTASTTSSAPSSPRWESLGPDQKRALKRELARSSPAGFAAVASRGMWKLAPHLKLLNGCLMEIVGKTIDRLSISMPPRHGKSELVSKYFLAWYLCTFPDRRVLLASYEADFAAQWGRKVRDLVDELGPRYFGVSVRRDSSASDRWEIDGHPGGMQTAGIGGALTGKGAHLFVIDDPVKNAEEANSEAIRARNWDWYRAAAYTRLEPDGAFVLMQTRWHEEDLAGMVLKEAKANDESWTVLNLPALSLGEGDPLNRAEGLPLWPERYDRAALLRIKATLGSYWFSALYQGSPQPAEGGVFKRSWLRSYRTDGDLYLLATEGDGAG
jgi:hypothetical protein